MTQYKVQYSPSVYAGLRSIVERARSRDEIELKVTEKYGSGAVLTALDIAVEIKGRSWVNSGSLKKLAITHSRGQIDVSIRDGSDSTAPTPINISWFRMLRMRLRTLGLQFKAGVFSIAFVLLFFCTLLVLDVDIQRESYGPLRLSIILAFALSFILYLLKQSEDRIELEAMILQTYFYKFKYRNVLIIFLLPLLISALQNKSLFGAFNPVSYWKSEEVLNNTKCNLMANVALNAIESIDVVQNKKKLGLVTTNEMLSVINGSKILIDGYNQCVEDQKNESDKINLEFKRLKINK